MNKPTMPTTETIKKVLADELKTNKPIKSISEETGKINIVPTFENLLVTYVRLYSRMNERGKKLIEMELSKYGKALDQIKH